MNCKEGVPKEPGVQYAQWGPCRKFRVPSKNTGSGCKDGIPSKKSAFQAGEGGKGGSRVRDGFTLQRWENWVNTELPAENSGSQKGHRSRLQRGQRLGRKLGIQAAEEEIRPEIRGSGCRRWGSGRKYGTLRGSGTQATEKGIQVRNTGFAAGNWRFSAPAGLRCTWAAHGPCAVPDAAQQVRPSRRPSPGSLPAPHLALPRPQRAHPPPAHPTRRTSLSDQAVAVPTADARPPTAAASPRAHRLHAAQIPAG